MKEENRHWRLIVGAILATLTLAACDSGGSSQEQGAGQSGQSKGASARPDNAKPAVILQADESANPHLEIRQCIMIFKQGPHFRLSPVDCEGAPQHQMEYKTYKLKNECTPPSASCGKYSFKARFKGGGHTNWFDHDLIMKVEDLDSDGTADFDSNGLPIEVVLEPASHPDNDDHDIPGRIGGSHGGGAHYR